MNIRITLATVAALFVLPSSGGAGSTPVEARVIVQVETLPAAGAPPQARQARVYVTGTGYAPRGKVGTAQGRLLARRAAVVDGYQRIATATQRWRATSRGAQYYEPASTTAFVHGAVIEAERYFGSGRVEVDLSAPPLARAGDPTTPDGWRRFEDTATRAGLAVATTPGWPSGRRRISREEWEQLFAATRADGGE